MNIDRARPQYVMKRGLRSCARQSATAAICYQKVRTRRIAFSRLILQRNCKLSVYDHKPHPFLERLHFKEERNPSRSIYCAGYELECWRCVPFATHLIEWLPSIDV